MWRGVMLSDVPRLQDDLADVRAAVADWVAGSEPQASELPDSLKQLGVDSIRWEVFDPQALVYLQPGADGAPGVAGVDDNGNGVVDDKGELGATRTDDRIMVTADQINFDGPTLVLQRGAYVEVPRDVATQGSEPWRVVVEGRRDSDYWSFLVH